MTPPRSLLWCAFLFAFLGAGLSACTAEAPAESASAEPTPIAEAARTAPPPIRAVTLDARRPPEEATLRTLAEDIGATHLALIAFGFQERSDTPAIRMHTGDADGGGWYSETDAGIRTLARQADSLGMGLILKPHIWIGHYSAEGQERHKIGFETEAAWRRWEAHYRRFLMHYARLAEETGADVLVVGTELAGPAKARPTFWRGLIAEVREAYAGRLTYAANWYAEYEEIAFWDALDYVGVQAYFPISEEDAPTLEALRAGWAKHRSALRRMHERTGRPILFTEIGYRSVGYAAREPWRWPSREETAAPDPALQARLYQAFFEAMWDAPFLAGAVVWKWHPARSGDRPLGFTPQNKPAAEVIGEWFTAPPGGS